MSVKTQSPDELIRELLDSGANLPPLPAIGMKLLAALRKPVDQIDVHSVSRMIETDPTIAARILKIANSPYYSARGGITSLSQAVMQIGLYETINTVSFFVLREAMPGFPEIAGYSSDDFWAHSWATAMAGRMLAHPGNHVHCVPGEVYMAGLLHGIGKLVLVLHRPEEFARCLELARRHGVLLRQAEREVLGFTDSVLGSMLLKAWNLPPATRTAVGAYPAPAAAAEEYREMAALTQLAYVLATRTGIGHAGDGRLMAPEDTWFVQHGTGPLTHEETRKKLCVEIAVSLKEKARLYVGDGAKEPADGDEGADAAGQAAEPEAARQRRPAERSPARAGAAQADPGRRGFWTRVKGLVKS
jgi:HD-like signal output (HDOD) protein